MKCMPGEEGTSSVRSVFLTGGSGFLGQAVRAKLQEMGFQVFDLRDILKHKSNIVFDSRYFSSEQIGCIETIPFALVHCAGNSSIAASFSSPLDDIRANFSQTAELLEYLRRSSSETRFVFVSTSAVYGDAVSCSRECSKLSPVSPYGEHKMLAEKLVEFYGSTYGIRSSIIRPFSIYGPGQRKQLIWDALCRFKNGDFYFRGGANNVRDFIHVKDVASFVPYAIKAASSHTPVFNVSTGVGNSVRDAMELLAKLYAGNSDVEFGTESWPGDPRVLVGDNTCAKSLGWTPETSLRDGLETTVQWFKEQSI